MLRLMHRRGPDSAASYRFTAPAGRQAVLLHTRLSIIDLEERANQPFRVGSQVLVYNGELYNYVELRRELEALGQRFQTESDTEVLLRTLVQFGPDGLDRCEGMWAFAVLNEADGSLLLCRDRFGEKPLYLFRDATGLFFGSEIKFLAALRGKPFDVNDAASLPLSRQRVQVALQGPRHVLSRSFRASARDGVAHRFGRARDLVALLDAVVRAGRCPRRTATPSRRSARDLSAR